MGTRFGSHQQVSRLFGKLGQGDQPMVTNWNEEENLTEPKTVDWLKLFSDPVDEPENTICQAINRTLDDEVPSWPQEPTPRLYMGGWRIKNTNHPENPEEHDSPNMHGWTVIRPTSTFDRKSLNGPSLTNGTLTQRTTTKSGCSSGSHR